MPPQIVAHTMMASARERSRALVMDCAYGSKRVIEEFLQREIDAGGFPAAAWAVGSVSRGIVHEGALGHAVAVPLRIPATPHTIFDVASLTKPLITTTLVLQAVDEGRIALDDRFE